MDRYDGVKDSTRRRPFNRMLQGYSGVFPLCLREGVASSYSDNHPEWVDHGLSLSPRKCLRLVVYAAMQSREMCFGTSNFLFWQGILCIPFIDPVAGMDKTGKLKKVLRWRLELALRIIPTIQ